MDFILKAAFDLLVRPAAAVLRVFGYDSMGLRPDVAASYWRRRSRPVDLTSKR